MILESGIMLHSAYSKAILAQSSCISPAQGGLSMAEIAERKRYIESGWTIVNLLQQTIRTNSVKIFTERYTTNSDIGRKLGHYCIWNHCIADTVYAWTAFRQDMLVSTEAWSIHTKFWVCKTLYIQTHIKVKKVINAWNGEQNVYFLLHAHVK